MNYRVNFLFLIWMLMACSTTSQRSPASLATGPSFSFKMTASFNDSDHGNEKMGSIKGQCTLSQSEFTSIGERFQIQCSLDSGEQYIFDSEISPAPGTLNDAIERFVLRTSSIHQRAQLEFQLPFATLKNWALMANNSIFRARSTHEEFEKAVTREFESIPDRYIRSEFIDLEKRNFIIPFTRGRWWFTDDSVQYSFDFDN